MTYSTATPTCFGTFVPTSGISDTSLKLATICADYLRVLGASTSWASMGLSRPIQEELDLYNVTDYNRSTRYM